MKSAKLMKNMNKQFKDNTLLVVLGGLFIVYMLYNYNNRQSSAMSNVVASASAAAASASEMVGNDMMSQDSSVPVHNDNAPQDLLPADHNSEWSEFAPSGQGDLMGSGSLLHPTVSQRPFNSVQGANSLRGDPPISINEIPSLAAPSTPMQGNSVGLQ